MIIHSTDNSFDHCIVVPAYSNRRLRVMPSTMVLSRGSCFGRKHDETGQLQTPLPRHRHQLSVVQPQFPVAQCSSRAMSYRQPSTTPRNVITRVFMFFFKHSTPTPKRSRSVKSSHLSDKSLSAELDSGLSWPAEIDRPELLP